MNDPIIGAESDCKKVPCMSTMPFMTIVYL